MSNKLFILCLIFITPMCLAEERQAFSCELSVGSNHGQASTWYVFEIDRPELFDPAATIVPLELAHDVESISSVISSRQDVPKKSVVLRDASFNVSSDYCRVTIAEGQAIGIRYCHYGFGGITTFIISAITPPSGGTVLIPISVNGRSIILAHKLMLLETSSNHPELKILEMKENDQLERDQLDIESKRVEDRSFPAIDLSAYATCG